MAYMAESTVEHDEANQRFRIALGDEDAYLAYHRSGSVLDFYYTYVPESHRGQRLAEKICHAAFEFAKSRKLTVIPSCPYISRAYLQRHKEYVPLIQT
jgi:uncharacterized protein